MRTFNPTISTPYLGAPRLASVLYATTLFLSALLLFLIQPMFTKMVLPRLGGAPTVWSVAMVFFQAALLAGYVYAPLLVRWFAASGHPQAGNPYVLYAASNLGSFAALLAYPILIEPMLTLADQ